MGHYWHALSGGRLDFRGETVVGWYELPEPIGGYFEDPAPGDRLKPDWGRLARDCASLADGDVDFSSVHGVNLQFNVKFGAAWGGSSVLALDGEPRLFGVTWMPTWVSQSTYGHEIGHTFGLPHSSGPYDATYDSRWDVMSNGNTLWDPELQTTIGQHTIGYHRDLLGWIPADRRWSAEAFGAVETVSLEFWNQTGGAGWSLLEVPLRDGTFYTVEARQLSGYDAGIPFRGVVLHHVDPWRPDRHAQVVDVDGNGDPNDEAAAWTPGETFTDRSRGVELTVLGELGGTPGVDEGFLVAVTRGWRLNLEIVGTGWVRSPAFGLEWTASSSHLFPHSGTVTLEAEAGEGLAFAGWDDPCSGAGSCSVDLTEYDEVAAEFAAPLVILSETERSPGMVGAWYQDRLEASGGASTRTWILSGGVLPRGLELDSGDGTVRGIPEVSGEFAFSVTAVSKALQATADFELSVGEPSLRSQDAVAELLRRGSALSIEETRYLDLKGNHNGRLDIGDVLLFLKEAGR
jgi:M6 family metalloprotease-like protein